MSQQSLDNFGAYRKGMELFDLVVQDMEQVRHDPRCWKLVAQQTACADSICANIEEGAGKGTSADDARFLDIARGSARETRGRYLRMKHWLPAELIAQRAALLDEITGILTATINRLRSASYRRESQKHHEAT
jgi:four helix bundle protein